MSDSGLASGTLRRRALGAFVPAELLEAQRQSLEVIVRGAPLRDVLVRLTQIAEAHAPDEVVASILLLREGRLYTGAAPSLPESYCAAFNGREVRADRGTCSASVATRRLVVTPDIDRDPNWGQMKHLPLGLGLVAAWSQPIIGADGEVVGAFGVYLRHRREPDAMERALVETLAHAASLAIERERSEARARDQHELIELAFDAAEMGAWRYDVVANRWSFDARAQRLYCLDGEIVDSDEKLRAVFHPDDVDAMSRAVNRAADPDGDGRFYVEYRVRRLDGDWRWLMAWGRAQFEEHGGARRTVRIVGASRDITAQRNAERQRELLVDELNHRVRNTLTIVQSVAAQTLRSTQGPEAFTEAFTNRVSALARTHSLLTQAFWEATPLSRVVDATLGPFAIDGGDRQIRCYGPCVTVKPEVAVTLSLVLNELATNAAKYGALSTPGGQVEVTWRVIGPGRTHDDIAEIRWAEAHGPPVQPPKARGFGSRLIAKSAGQLGGRVEHRFEGTGVTCVLEAPVASRRAEA
jgi:two-component sensor histidine kinase